MSKRIKNNKNKPVLDRKHEEKVRCPGNLAFSFAYLTTNKGYNFDYFTVEKDAYENQKALLEKLREISSIKWEDFLSRRKENGRENIPAWQLNFSPAIIELDKDTKVTSIRYNHQKYRIIGEKRSRCDIFYIYGFDFNFSAYNHGS